VKTQAPDHCGGKYSGVDRQRGLTSVDEINQEFLDHQGLLDITDSRVF
jgi:hypothetical protein